jgi:lysozyme
MKRFLIYILTLLMMLSVGSIEETYARKHHRHTVVKTTVRQGRGRKGRAAKTRGRKVSSKVQVRRTRSYHLGGNGQRTMLNVKPKVQRVVVRRHHRKIVRYVRIYTPPLSQTFDGIDISHYQRTIRWHKMSKRTRLKFVYIKATEGAMRKDGLYKLNVERARAAGYKIGSYHFFRPDVSAKRQFDNFKSHVNLADQDLLPLIDIEDCGVLNRKLIQNRLRELIDLMTDYYGQKPMLYTMISFYNSYLANDFMDYPLMLGSYSKKPVTVDSNKFCIWQFTSSGKINGISGNVDLNVFNTGYDIGYITLKKDLVKDYDAKVREEAIEKGLPIPAPEPKAAKVSTPSQPAHKAAPAKAVPTKATSTKGVPAKGAPKSAEPKVTEKGKTSKTKIEVKEEKGKNEKAALKKDTVRKNPAKTVRHRKRSRRHR